MNCPWSTSLFRATIPALCGLLLALPLPVAAAVDNSPAIISISQAVLNPGRSYDLIVRFSNPLKYPIARLDFGTGIAAQRRSGTSSDENQTWNVSVAPTAPGGARRIVIYYRPDLEGGEVRKDTNTSVTVEGDSAEVDSPDILSVTPSALKIGGSYELQVRFSNRREHTITRLDFGAGIVASRKSGHPKSSNQIWSVQVSAAAPKGVHKIHLHYSSDEAEYRRPTGASVTVAADIPPPSKPQPTVFKKEELTPALAKPLKPPPAEAQRITSLPEIFSLSPNTWNPGKTYDLRLVGRNLAAGLQVRFGEGVAVKGEPQIASATLVNVKIEVAPDAASGERRAEAAPAKGQRFARTSATAQVISPGEAPTRKKEVIPRYETSIVVPKLGKITLIAPEASEEGTAGGAVFNEDTTFQWQEENPGLAEEFELRIVYLESDGTQTPVVAARIRPQQGAGLPPTHFAPDRALWDQLTTGTFKDKGDTEKRGGLVIDPALKDQFTPDAIEPRNAPTARVGGRAILWQVAGYRAPRLVQSAESGTPRDGGAAVPGRAIETPATPGHPADVRVAAPGRPPLREPDRPMQLVAESGLRFLRLPLRPLGLWCFGGGDSPTPEGNRGSHDLKVSPPPSGVVYYTKDPVKVSGSIALADLPYKDVGESFSPEIGQASTRHDNILIDWGDETGATPVSTHPTETTAEVYNLNHRYAAPDTYVVRIFMLPAADLWSTDPSTLAPAVTAVDPSSPSPWYNDREQYGGGEALDVARRAYLIYCSSITVNPRKDPVSEGPLQLDSVAVSGFNGEGKQTAVEPGDAGKVIPKTPGAVPDAVKPGAGAVPAAAVDAKSLPVAGTDAGSKVGTADIARVTSIQLPQGPPSFGECSSVQGDAVLSYYGCGSARVEWRLEDLDSGASEIVSGGEIVRVGPSPARTDLPPPLTDEEKAELEAASPVKRVMMESVRARESPPLLGTLPLSSPVVKLGKDQVGKRFALRVSATVVSHCQEEAEAAARATPTRITSPLGRPSKSTPIVPAGFQKASRNKPAKKGSLGVLSPYREGASGRTGVGYYDASPLGGQTGEFQKAAPAPPRSKPLYVESDQRPFQVAASDPNLPCRFLFTTADGGFKVDTLQDLRDLGGGRWSGRGVFHYFFAEGDAGKKEKLTPATFSSWLARDGHRVTDGTLDVRSPAPDEIGAHGMRVRITALTGTAGDAGGVNLALSASLPESWLAGRKPSWSAAAPLSSAGDWIAAAGPIERVPLAYSSHDIESTAAVLDLSDAANLEEPSRGCGSGPGWMGFHFGDARLLPNTFGLFAGLRYDAPGWTAGSSGICGRTFMPLAGGPTTYKLGVLGWESIDARADGKGNIRSIYQGFTATVPAPFEATFAGTVVLIDQPGKEPFPDFSSMTGPSNVERSYPTPAGGRIGLTADGFGFGVYGELGWGIKANVGFSFEADGKTFAGVSAMPLIEGFDGHLYRGGGSQSPVSIPIGSGTVIGENVPAVVDMVQISGFGSAAVDFGFAVKVRISEQLSETPMPVGYRLLQQQGATYAARGPIAAPFEQVIVYNGGGDRGVDSKVLIAFTRVDGAGDGVPHKKGVMNCMSGDFFCGETDGLKLMGASVKASFRLGYKQGSDYFALMAEVSGLNVPLPPFALYGVRGGLAHNFKLTDFLQEEKSILEIEPDMGGDFVFVAGLAAGLASDPSLLSFDATLLISTGEQPMLKFKAWLLSPKKGQKGNEKGDAKKSAAGDVWGFFTVGAGGFDGAIAGEKSLPGGTLLVRMPGSIDCYDRPSVKDVVACAQASWASVIHFGGLTDWYIYIGQRNGPKVEAVIAKIFNPKAYVMLQGIGGLSFGASWQYTKEVRAGKFRAGFSLGATFDGQLMWPEPIGIAAQARQWADVHGCYKGECISAGVTIWIGLEFSTAQTLLAAGFEVEGICPFDYVKFGVQVMPSLGLTADVDWCDYVIF